MEYTTIKVTTAHRSAIEALKVHPREVVDDVIGRLLEAYDPLRAQRDRLERRSTQERRTKAAS